MRLERLSSDKPLKRLENRLASLISAASRPERAIVAVEELFSVSHYIAT